MIYTYVKRKKKKISIINLEHIRVQYLNGITKKSIFKIELTQIYIYILILILDEYKISISKESL